MSVRKTTAEYERAHTPKSTHVFDNYTRSVRALTLNQKTIKLTEALLENIPRGQEALTNTPRSKDLPNQFQADRKYTR